VRELRELTRYRTSLVRDRARTINRLQKVLEAANIKLASVVSDIDGVSARLMLEGLVAGERDTEQLASLAKGRLKEKHAQLVEALSGRLQPIRASDRRASGADRLSGGSYRTAEPPD